MFNLLNGRQWAPCARARLRRAGTSAGAARSLLPGEDAVAHQHLQIATHGTATRLRRMPKPPRRSPPAIWGVPAVATSASSLDSGKVLYERSNRTDFSDRRHGGPVDAFDVISGLSGVALLPPPIQAIHISRDITRETARGGVLVYPAHGSTGPNPDMVALVRQLAFGSRRRVHEGVLIEFEIVG